MEEYKDDSRGNDLLGEFFQQEITHGRNGQFFTPSHVSSMMAKIVRGEEDRTLRVFDPACGSGRMLMAFARESIIPHYYYGIDIDLICVKMTAINLFLNGLRGEVICVDALAVDDFRFGYRISFLPFGIFKIEEKEKSLLWHLHKSSFSKEKRPEQPQLSLF